MVELAETETDVSVVPHFEWRVAFFESRARFAISYENVVVHTRASRRVEPSAVLTTAILKCRRSRQTPPRHKWTEVPAREGTVGLPGYGVWAFRHRDGQYAEVYLVDRNVELMVAG